MIDYFFAVGWMRKGIWKFWYPLLTRRLAEDEVTFLNYAYETEPPMAIPLRPEDEPNRACIQLYHQVASPVSLQGRQVLEVSCGHGGGAAYLARTFAPKSYTGLDLNAAGVRFCRKRHEAPGLEFVQGDAENLPFAAESFDVVLNVEASHCYPNFPRFLVEVARVLRPGGHFLYTDFRFADRRAEWESALTSAPLQRRSMRDINAEVLRGMAGNSGRSQALVRRHLPGWLQGLGRDFAGVKGSRVYNGLLSGELKYRTYHFQKVKGEQGGE